MFGFIASVVIGVSSGLASILPGVNKANSMQLADQLSTMSGGSNSVAVAAATSTALVVETVKEVYTPNASGTIISAGDHSMLKLFKPAKVLALMSSNKIVAGILGCGIGSIIGGLVNSSSILTGAVLTLHLIVNPSSTKMWTCALLIALVATTTLICNLLGLTSMVQIIGASFLFIPSAFRGLKQRVLLQQPARDPVLRTMGNKLMLNPYNLIVNALGTTSTAGAKLEPELLFVKDAVNASANEALVEGFAIGAGFAGVSTGKALSISLMGAANIGIVTPLVFITVLCLMPLFIGSLVKFYSSLPVATVNLAVLLVNLIQLVMAAGIYAPLFILIGFVGSLVLKQNPALSKMLYLGALL